MEGMEAIALAIMEIMGTVATEATMAEENQIQIVMTRIL